MENWERQEERKRSKGKGKKERWYPNSRARPPRSGDCDNAWTSSLRKGGTEVDYQVAAPTESSTPNLHRATIAQQRVRMEGWRQRRLGSNAKPLIERKKKNQLDTHRSSHGRTYPRQDKKLACIRASSLGESHSMPRHALKNAGDTLCHMFCGWRQVFSKSRLVELGSGTLEIDVLTSESVFGGNHIPTLPIASELQLSLQQFV